MNQQRSSGTPSCDSRRLSRQRPQSALPSMMSQSKQAPIVSNADMINRISMSRLPQQDSGEDQTRRNVWRAFGSYLAKQMINGKGVVVPKFGNFTFNAAEVDLGGTTNPQDRDKQWREPVFMVGKDFVSATKLRSGVSHNGGAQVRPCELQGSSGIIPKVKINYVEIGLFANKSKDFCRQACEQQFRQLSDRVRKGESVSCEIPLVGRFIVKTGIAAVAFTADFISQTRGNTAKNFSVGNLFGSSNAQLNLNIHKSSQEKTNEFLGLGGAIKVNDGASNWLKNNLDINLDELPEVSQSASATGRRNDHHNTLLARPGSAAVRGTLSQAKLAHLNGRLNSAKSASKLRSGPMRAHSTVTHTTAMASHMSILPNVDRMSLMWVAQALFKGRSAISSHCQTAQCKFNLRDVLSSSQMHSLLKKSGIIIDITHLKCLLRELGFPYNGPSTSFTLLLTACKAFLHGQTGRFQGHLRSSHSQSNFSGVSNHQQRGPPGFQSDNAKRVINMLRDVFYSTRISLFELFKANMGQRDQTLDIDAFRQLILDASEGTIGDMDIIEVWKCLEKTRSNTLSFEVFERIFRSEVPTGVEFETTVVRQLREWMFQNKLSSEMAFDTLCRSVGRFVERNLSRASFHQALSNCEVGLSAAQTDALFALLTSEAGGSLDLNMWQAVVFEDGDNPLQMIREIVAAHGLTQDDLLHQMKLKVWDEPLDQQSFFQCLRALDQSVSDSQIKALFYSMRGDDGCVEVPKLVRNFTGRAYETVDFRNKIFRVLYTEIYPDQEEKVIKLLQQQDTDNVGMINAQQLLNVLQKVCSKVNIDDLDRFVRFLEKDKLGKLNYMEFLGKMSKLSNKNHNPFKSTVNRLSYFLKQNKITAADLLTRLCSNKAAGCSVETFTSFLKQKVDKKREVDELRRYASMIDIDKDGVISAEDIMTCVKNLSNGAFFKNQGSALQKSTFNTTNKFFPTSSAMSKEKALEVCQQIREALGAKRMQYKELWTQFDTNGDNYVSYAEFQRGIKSLINLAEPVIEQVYACMDKNNIGLINYEQFLEVLRLNNIKKSVIEDNFDWENGIINSITQWISRERLTVEEAFKCFDKDFDGFISKADMKASLSDILEVDPKTVVPTKLDRLFRLMDFFKTGMIQLSDFVRIIDGDNPYAGTNVDGAVKNMARSLGGGLSATSTFDWKFSAVQSIGLAISRKFPTLKESFAACSNNADKITFDNFNAFLSREQALQGFNLTLPLVQKLFAELDPHKKGFLNANDWSNAFAVFNWCEQLMIELKNVIQCTFANSDSVFSFFLNFGDKTSRGGVSWNNFERAVNSLTSERFKQKEIRDLWQKMSGGASQMDRFEFRKHFEQINYRGNSTVKSVGGATSLKSNSTGFSRATITTKTSSSSQWETNIIEKVRSLITASSKSLQEIFNDMDEDGNGTLSPVEFRNAIRKLNLCLSAVEIDQLMARIDSNSDGRIDYTEFCNKFKPNTFDVRMKTRAASRLASLKELMIMHMTSANDAFRFFDIDKNGKMTFQDFSELVLKVHEVASEKAPTYPVIKDLFDTIDIRKDGILDLKEWQQTFGHVTQGSTKLSIRPTPLTMWENSREFGRIGHLLAKSRKQLIESFKSVVGANTTLFNFQQGKKALDEWLYTNFKNDVNDEKLACLFRTAQVQSQSQEKPTFDYIKMLDVFKARHSGM